MQYDFKKYVAMSSRQFLFSLKTYKNLTLIFLSWHLSKFSNISADDMLYTETDLEESMDKIETINFHEVKEVAGIKFWCYHAGHVLGAGGFRGAFG